MNHFFRLTAVGLFLISFSPDLFSQPAGITGSDGDSMVIYKWDVSSKRIGDGKYELVFSTNGVAGWQLYSPSQTIADLTTTEIKFGDSAISQRDGFIESGTAKSVLTPVS